jgi:hypothetical protein
MTKNSLYPVAILSLLAAAASSVSCSSEERSDATYAERQQSLGSWSPHLSEEHAVGIPLEVAAAAEKPLVQEELAPVRAIPDFPPDTTFGDLGHCRSMLPPASACEWARTADAVVLATVESLEFVYDPVYGPARGGGLEAATACKFIKPALALTIQVRQSMLGTLKGKQIIWVGAAQVDQFDPLPTPDVGGGIAWHGRSRSSGRSPLTPGQRIVVALHRTGGDRWSLMGEPILGVSSSGNILAKPSAGDCFRSTPAALDGTAIGDLRNSLQFCSLSVAKSAQERRVLRRLRWDNTPIVAYAAECADGLPDTDLLPEQVPRPGDPVPSHEVAIPFPSEPSR